MVMFFYQLLNNIIRYVMEINLQPLKNDFTLRNDFMTNNYTIKFFLKKNALVYKINSTSALSQSTFVNPVLRFVTKTELRVAACLPE